MSMRGVVVQWFLCVWRLRRCNLKVELDVGESLLVLIGANKRLF
jgi:hypothetical protein